MDGCELRYLKGTADRGLKYDSVTSPLVGYADADWGGSVNDRRSDSGYVFLLGNGVISWESKQQRMVALSSTEAEYMNLSEATREAMHLRKSLSDLGFHCSQEVKIYNDNFGARMLVENPVFHARSKHIDIRHHFVRDDLKDGIISVEYVPTEDMVADMLTKGLPGPKVGAICIGR